MRRQYVFVRWSPPPPPPPPPPERAPRRDSLLLGASTLLGAQMPGAWGPRLLFPPDANLSSSTHHLHYYLFTPELARVQPPAERRLPLVVYLHGGVKPRGRENNSSALPAEAFHSAGAQLRHPCFVLRPITVRSVQPRASCAPCPLSCHPGLRPLVSLGLRAARFSSHSICPGRASAGTGCTARPRPRTWASLTT